MSKFTYNIKRYTVGALKASILCIRFPFLYPRNRFTGRHYTNWKIVDYARDLVKQYSKYETNEPVGKVYNFKVDEFEKLGTYYGYWINWWAKPIHDIIMWYHNTILQFFHCIPTYTELDAMPRGWRKAFGIQMCKEIKHYLKKTGYLHKYRITDIKEKWGELAWYDSGAPAEVTKVINKYAYISRYTCIVCGELATAMTPVEYWASPYCDEHFPKRSKYRLTYGMKDCEWYGWRGNIHRYDEKKFKELEENYKAYVNGEK